MIRTVALVILLVLAGLTTWVRSPAVKANLSQSLSLTPLDIGAGDIGEATLESAWHLDSPNSLFGSYSSLLAMPDDQFLSASDSGGLLRFPIPGADGTVEIGRFAGRTAYKKKLIDIESLTRDPQTGRIWVGYEGTNTIERLESDLTGSTRVQPDAMAGWASNSGPESMVRLSDGRFIVIAEGRESYLGSVHQAILFDGDPLEGAIAQSFRFEPPKGYRPVDMAQLPDGRVVILARKLVPGLPPSFNTKLVVADPSQIASGGNWSGREMAAISDPDLEDNYEGLAIIPRKDGTVDLWLISDDNGTTFQRTLLVKLHWDPATQDAQ
ncbi:esterase-like activity of phytase family protein [Pontixanthobacter aquaemixtae]|uniref:Esterase-like activity of phytase family protein n=1 Tax=Pontixanthobacter aquaemixtae TaxID=1958940 RepID=A0A844ZX01_9SPHN|nr:esterase-like activity of phytase family protein [Pontixanthobacter aquaemixtae]MXO91476.1 esterase-like activity of phytase family protein [Pontixanthobacter aquaemixtae]